MKRNAVNPRNVRLFYGFNFAFDVGPLVKREEQTLADWMSPLNQISRLHFVPRRSGRPMTVDRHVTSASLVNEKNVVESSDPSDSNLKKNFLNIH